MNAFRSRVLASASGSCARSLLLALALAGAGCASFDGRGLQAGASSADVERVMGRPAEKRTGQAGETTLFYPRQPYGRRTYAARIGADGRLIGVEQRLTDANVAKILPNTTRAAEVRDLLGPPWTASRYAGIGRDVWTWQMNHLGDPGIPVELVVQMSGDGVVREVYMLQEGTSNSSSRG